MTKTMQEVALEALDQLEVRRSGFFQPTACVGFLDDDCKLDDDLHEDGDIYEILDGLRKSVKIYGAPTDGYFALDTCGWAAPLDEARENTEIAPSEHIDRRRVRVVLVINAKNGEVASALKFEDTSEVITDAGEATGPLADAIKSVFQL